MSAFVLRFVGDPACDFRGTVRHVGTGEEAVFASRDELLKFIEELNAVSMPDGHVIESVRATSQGGDDV